ncbi:MAG: hypothetical protein Tsb0018_09850 [Opitutales bacterium]
MEDEASCTLFKAGNAEVTLVLQNAPAAELKASTQDFARILATMSGASFSIIPESDHQGEPAIFIGQTASSATFLEALPPDEEAILIAVQSPHLFLLGRTEEASSHAIYTFLEHYGHCHWYCPGLLGEHIPQRRDWSLAEFIYTHEPSYLSRELIGLNTEEERLWAKRNRLRPRFNYHHNLHTIFTQSVFEKHPEFFASVNGIPLPPTGDERGPQPNLASLEAAAFAGKAAIRFFEEHPESLSFSLGMNDSLSIGDALPTRALTEPIRFFRNRPDYADLIFTFINRAAETLAPAFPDKYLGCLAYFYAENVPSFPVAPKVIPYITADRSQYYDPNYRLEDEGLIARWRGAGPEITGLYDYYYGAPYAIPRIFTRYIEASLHYAYKQGTRAFTAELYPLWPFDMPKAWLAAQLLWDSSLKRTQLFETLYENYFQEAALPMAAFFSICEEAWIQQNPPGWWLKFYKSPDQAGLFSQSMLTSLRDYLDEAQAKAHSKIVRTRVQEVSELFSLTEALHACDLAEYTLEALPHNARTIETPITAYLNARQDLAATLEHLQENALMPGAPHYWAYLSNRSPLPSLFDRLAGQAALQSPALEAIIQEQGSPEDQLALRLFKKARPAQHNLLKNPDFENIIFKDGGLSLDAWGISTWPTPTLNIRPAEEATRSGDLGLLIEGANKVVLSQTFEAQPGTAYLFSIHLRGTRPTAGTAQIFISWKDNLGTSLGRSKIAAMPEKQNIWAPLTIIGVAPEETTQATCTLVIAHQDEEDALHIDDAKASSI